MNAKLFIISLLISVSLLWKTKVVIGYNVALVEFLYNERAFSILTPLQLANRNAKIYDNIVKDIRSTHGALDIVVFPEGTLVGEAMNTSEGRAAMTFVPSPVENTIPCNSSSTDFPGFFKLLSCTAKRDQTYLVINLKEKTKVFENQYSKTNFSWKFYNTNVVFDRNGKVVARYRKYNTYLERDTDKPIKPDHSTFDTDFGKTFGIFTCFDILFESPSIDLVRRGIKNFIFPTFWFPELPFLTTTQVQQMWAQGNDVDLLTAGAAFRNKAFGAMGIFLGNKESVSKIVSTQEDHKYLFQNVPEDYQSVCSSKVDDRKAKEMDKYRIKVEKLKNYNYKKLDVTKSTIIKENICQWNINRNFCCNFHIDINVDSTKINSYHQVYEYFLVVRSGFRSYGRNVYTNAIETCGIVACAGSTLQKCGQRFSDYDKISWPVTFAKINITTNFPNLSGMLKFPNSLLADFSPISPGCTVWEKEENAELSIVKQSFSTKVPITKLLTFSIFGRNYNEDAILNNTI